MKRTKVIPARQEEILEEDIHLYIHDEGNRRVVAYVTWRDPKTGEWRQPPGEHSEAEVIEGQDYDDLLAANGNGELPGKPAGVFRKDDLWPFIDRVRKRKATADNTGANPGASGVGVPNRPGR